MKNHPVHDLQGLDQDHVVIVVLWTVVLLVEVSKAFPSNFVMIHVGLM